jgi:hypothetical protein
MRWEFKLGIIIAGFCLLGAIGHLIWFMEQVDRTMDQIHKTLGSLSGLDPSVKELPQANTLRHTIANSIALMRVSLLSSGIMVGVAFGFLGFALFVMGITGPAKLNVEAYNARVWLESVAPGLIVLLVAAVLIGVCVAQPIIVQAAP